MVLSKKKKITVEEKNKKVRIVNPGDLPGSNDATA